MGLRRRVLPLTGWLALAVLLTTVTLTEQAMQRRQAQLDSARSVFALALAGTQLHLLQAVARVSSDQTLMQNLNWKLNHSVKATLEGLIERGSLDQINLFSRGCGELGRAPFDKPQPVACPPPAEMAQAKPSFQWLSGDQTTWLSLARPLSGSDGAAAVGLVQLDEQWLSLQPALKEQLTQLGLRLGVYGGVALVPPAKTSTDADALTLRSDRWLDRVLLSPAGQHWFIATSLVWPTLMLMLGWGLFVIWREISAYRLAEQGMGTFATWCRSLASSSGVVTVSPHADLYTELQHGLPAATALVTHALQVKSEAAAGQQSKRQSLETQLKSKEEELQKLKMRLAELAELDSLAIQLKRTTAIFLTRMDEFHSESDDLDQVTGEAMATASRELLTLATSWQEGVAERGSRKFIRSLAETAAGGEAPAAEETLSELDEQISTYYHHCLQLSDLAVNATRMTAKLRQTAAFAARMAGLWHALAMKSHDAEPCSSLAQPLEEAQAMVQLEPALKATLFINPQPADLGRAVPQVAPQVLTAALYHVYIATAEITKGKEAMVVTRLRLDQGKARLVIQAAAAGDESPLPQRSAKQAYHLDIARSMLAPFQVLLSVLPALEGPYPVALSWSVGGSSQPGKGIETGQVTLS